MKCIGMCKNSGSSSGGYGTFAGTCILTLIMPSPEAVRDHGSLPRLRLGAFVVMSANEGRFS